MKTISNYLVNVTSAYYPSATKEKVIRYLRKKDFLDYRSTARITDLVTGEKVEDQCHLIYSDGNYEWTSAEIYLFEKYNLGLDPEFIAYVNSKE